MVASFRCMSVNCERREAIQKAAEKSLDCFAALAMTDDIVFRDIG
jgi:hypothetical protein